MTIGRIFSFKKIFFVFFIGLCMGLSNAQAATTYSYYLDQTNIDIPGVMEDGTNYARVDISDSDSDDDIHFKVTVLLDAFGYESGDDTTNFGLDRFGFNIASWISLGDDNVIVSTSGSWGLSYNQQEDGFGKFSIEEAVSGGAGERTTVLDFIITGVDGDSIEDYALFGKASQLFATHIAGFAPLVDEDGDVISVNGEGVTSGYFAGSTPLPGTPDPGSPTVPVPSAAYLLGSGLICMVGLRRRKKK